MFINTHINHGEQPNLLECWYSCCNILGSHLSLQNKIYTYVSTRRPPSLTPSDVYISSTVAYGLGVWDCTASLKNSELKLLLQRCSHQVCTSVLCMPWICRTEVNTLIFKYGDTPYIAGGNILVEGQSMIHSVLWWGNYRLRIRITGICRKWHVCF